MRATAGRTASCRPPTTRCSRSRGCSSRRSGRARLALDRVGQLLRLDLAVLAAALELRGRVREHLRHLQVRLLQRVVVDAVGVLLVDQDELIGGVDDREEGAVVEITRVGPLREGAELLDVGPVLGDLELVRGGQRATALAVVAPTAAAGGGDRQGWEKQGDQKYRYAPHGRTL